MNSIILSGRVATKVKFRLTKQGVAVANFTLAIPNYKKKNSDGTPQTDFPRIQTWGRTAELCRDYLIVGKPCLIQGYLTTDTYEKNNQIIRTILVTANTVEFLGYTKVLGNQETNIDGEIPSKDVGMPPLNLNEEIAF